MLRASRNKRLLLLGGFFLLALAVVVLVIRTNAHQDDDAETGPAGIQNAVTGADASPAPFETAQSWGEGGSLQPSYTSMPAIAQTPMPTVVLITAAPTPAPTSSAMRLGDQGDDVRYVQQRLKDLGYLSGKVDGVYGSATETALKAFQAANGLSADGLVGKRTMDKLESSDAKAKPAENRSSATSVPRPVTYTPSEPTDYRYLQLGSTGRDVTKLQNRLIELGYFNQKATGSYEEETEVAVRAFQERNGQWVDGVAGQDTQSRLYSQKALPASKD